MPKKIRFFIYFILFPAIFGNINCCEPGSQEIISEALESFQIDPTKLTFTNEHDKKY